MDFLRIAEVEGGDRGGKQLTLGQSRLDLTPLFCGEDGLDLGPDLGQQLLALLLLGGGGRWQIAGLGEDDFSGEGRQQDNAADQQAQQLPGLGWALGADALSVEVVHGIGVSVVWMLLS